MGRIWGDRKAEVLGENEDAGMLEEDLRPLQAQFTDEELKRWERATTERLGAHVPSVEALVDALVADLDASRFGIAWWGGTSVARRILVSDQLVVSTRDLATNLREARLHQLEARSEWRRAESRHAVLDPGPDPRIALPTPTTPADELPRLLAELHTIGFFRSIGSALDCLAASVIGVLPLPLRIMKADLSGLRKWFEQAESRGDLDEVRLNFAHGLETWIGSVGPEGWLSWALDMRNMLVHRGRRMVLAIPDAVAPKLMIPPAGRRVRVRSFLPLDPARQEMEVLREGDSPFDGLLTEHAQTTIDGIYESARALVDLACSELGNVWSGRRPDPQKLPQPLDAQWPDLTASRPTGFVGYRPGSPPITKGAMVLNPQTGRRLQAGAVLDEDRHRWQEDFS